ncbi:hypothetical protein GJ496_004452 [Pomphorhynchus laevis]|nr:hypothetical protein GJ496_004452 [Pomphorhynchus laevis]
MNSSKRKTSVEIMEYLYNKLYLNKENDEALNDALYRFSKSDLIAIILKLFKEKQLYENQIKSDTNNKIEDSGIIPATNEFVSKTTNDLTDDKMLDATVGDNRTDDLLSKNEYMNMSMCKVRDGSVSKESYQNVDSKPYSMFHLKAATKSSNCSYFTDHYEQIRIRDCVVSNRIELDLLLEGRNHVNVNKLSESVEGFSIAILTTNPKLRHTQAIKTSVYSIINVSLFNGKHSTVFLFNEAHENHWTLTEASVIILIDVKHSEKGLSVSKASQLIYLGKSVDFSKCQGKNRSSNGRSLIPCDKIVDKRKAIFCTSHSSLIKRKIKPETMRSPSKINVLNKRSFMSYNPSSSNMKSNCSSLTNNLDQQNAKQWLSRFANTTSNIHKSGLICKTSGYSITQQEKDNISGTKRMAINTEKVTFSKVIKSVYNSQN